jgi:hypothetical protein
MKHFGQFLVTNLSGTNQIACNFCLGLKKKKTQTGMRGVLALHWNPSFSHYNANVQDFFTFFFFYFGGGFC